MGMDQTDILFLNLLNRLFHVIYYFIIKAHLIADPNIQIEPPRALHNTCGSKIRVF